MHGDRVQYASAITGHARPERRNIGEGDLFVRQRWSVKLLGLMLALSLALSTTACMGPQRRGGEQQGEQQEQGGEKKKDEEKKEEGGEEKKDEEKKDEGGGGGGGGGGGEEKKEEEKKG